MRKLSYLAWFLGIFSLNSLWAQSLSFQDSDKDTYQVLETKDHWTFSGQHQQVSLQLQGCAKKEIKQLKKMLAIKLDQRVRLPASFAAPHATLTISKGKKNQALKLATHDKSTAFLKSLPKEFLKLQLFETRHCPGGGR